MYTFPVDNGYGKGWNEKWGVKHFSIMEENLLPGEEVLMAFIGLHNYKSLSMMVTLHMLLQIKG